MVRSMIPLRNWKEINLAGAKQTWRDELTAQKVSKASLHLYPDTARSFPMHNPLPHCQQGARWRGSREQLVRAIRSILKDIRAEFQPCGHSREALVMLACQPELPVKHQSSYEGLQGTAWAPSKASQGSCNRVWPLPRPGQTCVVQLLTCVVHAVI